MTWARLDDNFYDHPKVVMAGTAAVGLFALALAYCSRHATDGVVTHGALERLAPDVDSAVLAQRLVDVGLWHTHMAGFIVHDYLHYNPSAKDVNKQRKAAAERMRNVRERSRERHANTARSSPDVRPPRPDPVPIPKEEGEAPASRMDEKPEPRPPSPALAEARPDLAPLFDQALRRRPSTPPRELPFVALYWRRHQSWPDMGELQRAIDDAKSASDVDLVTLVASFERFCDRDQNPEPDQFVRPKLWAKNLAKWLPAASATVPILPPDPAVRRLTAQMDAERARRQAQRARA